LNLKVKDYNELSDLEKLSLIDFSYSRIDTYNSCPAKYFYSYILKEPRSTNSAALLGNIVHSVLENTLENEKELNLEELQNEYNNNIISWDPDKIVSNELISVGKIILDNFYDENQDTKFNIIDKEMEFDFIIGSYRIRGFIDRVDLFGNRIYIIDYKTGKWEVALKDVATNLQLGIYALAISNVFPDKEVYAELYYLRSGKKKGHFFTDEDISVVKERLVKNIQKIINDNNFTPTTNTRICSYCEHAQSGICGVGKFRLRNSKAARY